ncbi:MAG: FAD binding domain-containing protein [Inquilinaceae bacterium]
MSYFAPTSLREALGLLAGGDVSVVAGGTDFFPALSDRPPPPALLDVTRVTEMAGISRTENGWRFGACVRWSDIVKAPLPACFDGLKQAAREVGSPQIQNAGTLAGNLCNASPAADGVPPLLTLDASVELTSATGTRRLPLDAFILGVRTVALRPGELMTAVHVPDAPATAAGTFLKLGSRRYLVISIAMVAVVVWLDEAGCIAGARVAVGSCSPVAMRLPTLETELVGLSAEDLRGRPVVEPDHLAGLSPIGDVRGSAEFRVDAARELCRRAVLAAVTPRDGADG